MKYRAFWLDVLTGRAVELKRSAGDVETHMQFVLEHPERFGLDPERVEQARTGPLPYEVSEYPDWIVKPLLTRFVKVNVDERYVSFTTQDRPDRKHIEAMQQFLIETKLTRLAVFVGGEPSGRMIGRTSSREFLGIDRPAELKRLVASPEGKARRFRAGQVWRRRDGLSYRLAGRVRNGWDVRVGQGSAFSSWRFTDRHLHNLVAAERLELRYRPVRAGTIVERLQAVGLSRQAAAVDEIERPELREAQDAERQLELRLQRAEGPEREHLERQLELVRDVLVQKGPVVEPTDEVTGPHMVSRDGVGKPHRVSR